MLLTGLPTLAMFVQVPKAEGLEVSVYCHPPASVFDNHVKFSLFDFFPLFLFLSAKNTLGKHNII